MEYELNFRDYLRILDKIKGKDMVTRAKYGPFTLKEGMPTARAIIPTTRIAIGIVSTIGSPKNLELERRAVA